MPEPPGELPLVGHAEIAAVTGRSKTAVSNWRLRNGDFPPPVAELACGPIFWWPQIERWLIDHELM